MIESQMIHVNPSQVISFDLNKKDIFRYVHRYVLYNFHLLFVNFFFLNYTKSYLKHLLIIADFKC